MVKLTKEQIKFYKHNGYVVLKNIFRQEEFDTFSKEYNRIFALKKGFATEIAWEDDIIKDAAENQAYSVDSVQDHQFHSEVFSDLVTNKNLLEAMEDIMETYTKAHKPPGKGAPYVIHQDYPYKNHSTVAIVLAVDSCTPENGGFCVYPGSHKNGPMEDHDFKGSTLQTYHWVDPKKYVIEGAIPVSLDAGDVMVFSYLLLHGSYTNLSERPSRMFLMQLCDADDEPTKETDKSHRIHNRYKSEGQGWVLRTKYVMRPTHFTRSFYH